MKLHKPTPEISELSFSNSMWYLAGIAILFLLLGSTTHLYWHLKKGDDPNELLLRPTGKLEHLKKFGKNYDLILWGDSRTYLGADPEIISSHTGLKTFNYANMAHWFPTQYPQLKRSIPYLKGKHVVWVIGRINFNVLNTENPDVNENFYLDIYDFIEYWKLGYRPTVLIDNLMRRYLPSNSILFKKNALQSRLNYLLDKDAFKSNLNGKENAEQVAEQKLIDAAFIEVDRLYPDAISRKLTDGKSESNVLVDVFLDNGHRSHHEVKPAYFRSLQGKWTAETSSEADYTINPIMFELFTRILSLFKDNSIELTVVEYRDAPYQTRHTAVQNAHRTILDKMKKIVLDSGYDYLQPDMSPLRNEDYFDYNHLNTVGARKYSTILGEALGSLAK